MMAKAAATKSTVRTVMRRGCLMAGAPSGIDRVLEGALTITLAAATVVVASVRGASSVIAGTEPVKSFAAGGVDRAPASGAMASRLRVDAVASPTRTSMTRAVTLSCPPARRASSMSAPAAATGSVRSPSTEAIATLSTSLLRPSLHNRSRSPAARGSSKRSTATSASTPSARVSMCRCGCTAAWAGVSSPLRTISAATEWSLVMSRSSPFV